MGIKVLLLQARRGDDPMAEHEHRCFVDVSELPRENLVVHDLCHGPPSTEAIKRFDALMIGGSGEFYISKGNLPQFESYLDMLREVVAKKIPMFASCFGYQSLVHALGGDVIHDPDNTEIGTYELTLTKHAEGDPLFGNLPETFWAQMGHKDRAARHPDGLPNFASSAGCRLQALRIPNEPIWAAQFHPELDRDTNQDRYRHYLKGYAQHMTPEEQEGALSRFKASPDASAMIKRFLDIVFE